MHMLDALVTLRTYEDLTKIAGEKLAVEPTDRARSATVNVRLYARAPECDYKLMLWDDVGRNPTLLEPQSARTEPGLAELEWTFDNYSVGDLRGRTVTWSVRLVSPRADSFEVRVEVFQGAEPAPGGRFFYAGPLDASEIVERAGRFHFTVGSQPAQAL